MSLYKVSFVVDDRGRKGALLNKALDLLNRLEQGGNLSEDQKNWPALIRAELEKLGPDAAKRCSLDPSQSLVSRLGISASENAAGPAQ